MSIHADPEQELEQEQEQEQEQAIDTEAIENEAKTMGWVPLEEFKGKKEHWRDAEEFVEKGRHVMPILLANNKRLQADLLTDKTKLNTLEAKLASAQKGLAKLETYYAAATARAVEAAKKDLLAQLKAAREDDDFDGEEAIREKLEALKAPPDEPAAEPEQPKLSPEFEAWQSENPWFNTDKKRTKAILRIAEDIRDDGNTLQGRQFMDACLDKLLESEEEPAAPVRRASKVETGSNRGGNTNHSTGHSFADLPHEAKQACWGDIDDLVGPDKAYKTKADWEKGYATIYWGMMQ